MLLATALALLVQDVLNRRFTVQNKPAAVAPRKPSPIISSFLEIGQKKTVDAAKICGGAENVVKTETQQTFVKWIARFYYFGHLYSAGSACVLLTIIAWVAHRYGQLYLHCSLIYFWVPSSCFCIVISLSLGEIIPFSGVCQSGEAALSTPEAIIGFTHWLTDCWYQPTDDQRQHHHAEHHFSFSIS